MNRFRPRRFRSRAGSVAAECTEWHASHSTHGLGSIPIIVATKVGIILVFLDRKLCGELFWGQRTCRQSHWMTERPKIPNSVRQNTGIRGTLEGWVIKRENAARSAMRTARQARRKPPRLVDRLCWNSPREKKAQEVVMPQLGQGIPKRIRTEQGGSPNC